MLSLLSSAALTQSTVTLTVDTASHGYAIPTDFSGLSFETGSELIDHNGVSGHFFAPTNTQLITLFQNIGLKNLRIGGGSVNNYTPTNPDIDSLFAFAPLAGVKVIYSVPLYNACASCNATTASYVWQYQPSLHSFTIGNEQDWKTFLYPPNGTGTDSNLKDLPSFITDWQNFATTILGSVPSAKFSGPETGAYDDSTYYKGTVCGGSYPSGISWTQGFSRCEKSSGVIAAVTQHHYVGGSPGGTTAQQAIDHMLSTEWVNSTSIGTQAAGTGGTTTYVPYPWIYNNNLAPVLADGLPYRMTEANDYLSGVDGGSNAFSSALWALDYMQWWAAHGAAGVNFHNKQWLLTGTIVPNPNPCNPVCGDYQTRPKGYGMKAFDLGGHGYVEPVTISNPDGVNLTAYAVGNARDLYVTIINKTHGASDGTDASVTIQPTGFTATSAAYMVLTDGQPGNASLLTATLGGASITNNSRWLGQWTPLAPGTNGNVTLTVQATTAVVVKIRAASTFAGPVQINQNGALELFGTGSNGDTWHIWQKAANVPNSPLTNWSSWTDIQGGITSSGGPAVFKNQDNTLEVFVPSTTGNVYHNWQLTPSGGWSGWSDLGGSGINYLVAAPNADGSASVFGIGSNGDVWVNSQSAPGVGWSGWTDLSGVGIQPGFVVGQNLNGRVEVFGVDGSGNVWHNWQTSSGSWSGWNLLSGLQSNPRLAVARNLDGRLELFGADSSGYVWHNWQTSAGGSWNGWSKITGKQLKPGFVVGQHRDGRLVLFGVASASPFNVFNIWQQGSPGGNFGGNWTDMGGSGMNPQLVVSNTADGRIQLFGVGANNNVWSNWQPSGSGWNGWADFGGSGTKLYTGQ